jgi:pyrroloquinoline quinone biosynthesis protein E
VVVTPDGTALPCHQALSIGTLSFENVQARSLADIWNDSPAFRAFRGEGWMPEPCRSCDERERDFGGCRCQAFALVGDAGATDPACDLAPRHDLIVAARLAAERESPGAPPPIRLRRMRAS